MLDIAHGIPEFTTTHYIYARNVHSVLVVVLCPRLWWGMKRRERKAINHPKVSKITRWLVTCYDDGRTIVCGSDNFEGVWDEVELPVIAALPDDLDSGWQVPDRDRKR